MREANYGKEAVDHAIKLNFSTHVKPIRKVKSKDIYWIYLENLSTHLVKPAGQKKMGRRAQFRA